SHAAMYAQCTEVGGTHPALVEAMGYGNPIVALETPEHREVLGDVGCYYRTVEELAVLLKQLASDGAERERLSTGARTRAARLYAWDAIAEQYIRACETAATLH